MAFTWKDRKDIFKGEGIYHLTFVVVNRAPILGMLEPLLSPDNEGHIATVCPTNLGKAVLAKMKELATRYPQLQIIWKQLMPDHLHAVVWMHEGYEGHLKMMTRGFAQGCSKIARRYARDMLVVAQSDCADPTNKLLQSSPTPANKLLQGSPTLTNNHPQDSPTPANSHLQDSPTLANNHPQEELQLDSHSANLASKVTPREMDPYDCGNGAHTLFSTPFIRTLARSGQLDTMVKYVKSNPDNAWMVRMNPSLYVIRRDVECAGLHFDTMGKSRLLYWPDTQTVDLPREMSQVQINKEIQKALGHASRGAVTYTAAMSRGEKELAKAIRNAGYPLVVMMLDGFPAEGTEAARYYHPGGIYHKTCSQGRLLLMAPHPTNYQNPAIIALTDAELQQKAEAKHLTYTSLPHTSKRWRMIAGNIMLRIINERYATKT